MNESLLPPVFGDPNEPRSPNGAVLGSFPEGNEANLRDLRVFGLGVLELCQALDAQNVLRTTRGRKHALAYVGKAPKQGPRRSPKTIERRWTGSTFHNIFQMIA